MFEISILCGCMNCYEDFHISWTIRLWRLTVLLCLFGLHCHQIWLQREKNEQVLLGVNVRDWENQFVSVDRTSWSESRLLRVGNSGVKSQAVMGYYGGCCCSDLYPVVHSLLVATLALAWDQASITTTTDFVWQRCHMGHKCLISFILSELYRLIPLLQTV